MPIFALPIPTASSAPQSRVRFSSLPVRNKRKRDASPTHSLTDDENDDSKSQHSRSEAAASTNPLSLTPEEVVQYRLAGLELDQEIPRIKGWPHRGLPAEPISLLKKNAPEDIEDKRSRKGKAPEAHSANVEDDGVWDEAGLEEGRRKDDRGSMLRLQHLAVLTAILHRSLSEGEIQRASRAWAMLIRAQVGGRGIDLRASGYWTIGAELLIRSGETPESKSPRHQSSMVGSQDEEYEAHQSGEADIEQSSARRYGSAEGMGKAKEYYERLILEHPYKRQFQGSVSALDFWPALVGCGIYGIQHEYRDGIRKLASAEKNDDDSAAEGHSDSDLQPVEEEGEDVYTVEQRRKARKRQERDERLWQQRENIRKTALVAYEQIAERMDGLMTTPPYSDSHVLLRLRAMLALCIGDHMVPALPSDDEVDTEDHKSLERHRRLLIRQRMADHERGRQEQREEHIRGRKLFEKIEKEGGRKESITNSLPGDEDAEESFDAD